MTEEPEVVRELRRIRYALWFAAAVFIISQAGQCTAFIARSGNP